MLYSYYLKENDIDKGHYQFTLRKDRVLIVTSLRSNDHRWKDKYFFMKGELMYWPCGL